MAWIKVDQSLRDHRKLLSAADYLNIPLAYLMGMIISLWLWALDNAPTGNLGNISARTIARAAQWDGDPQELLAALTEAGFLDGNDGALEIHNWYEWTGRLLERRQREKERSARRRIDGLEKSKQPAVDQRSTAGRVEQTTVDQRRVDDTHSSPSTEEEERKPLDNEVGFDTFWEHYPKKVGKTYARKVWDELNPDAALVAKIIDAVDKQKNSKQWTKSDGQYIPNPASWLEKGYWDNEEISENGTNKGITTPDGNWTDGFRTVGG